LHFAHDHPHSFFIILISLFFERTGSHWKLTKSVRREAMRMVLGKRLCIKCETGKRIHYFTRLPDTPCDNLGEKYGCAVGFNKWVCKSGKISFYWILTTRLRKVAVMKRNSSLIYQMI
jgi:hypothetical protein